MLPPMLEAGGKLLLRVLPLPAWAVKWLAAGTEELMHQIINDGLPAFDGSIASLTERLLRLLPPAVCSRVLRCLAAAATVIACHHGDAGINIKPAILQICCMELARSMTHALAGASGQPWVIRVVALVLRAAEMSWEHP
jgi:hypothetical protein